MGSLVTKENVLPPQMPEPGPAQSHTRTGNHYSWQSQVWLLCRKRRSRLTANLSCCRTHRQLEAMGMATGNPTKPVLEADISASTPLANMIR